MVRVHFNLFLYIKLVYSRLLVTFFLSGLLNNFSIDSPKMVLAGNIGQTSLTFYTLKQIKCILKIFSLILHLLPSNTCKMNCLKMDKDTFKFKKKP